MNEVACTHQLLAFDTEELDSLRNIFGNGDAKFGVYAGNMKFTVTKWFIYIHQTYIDKSNKNF